MSGVLQFLSKSFDINLGKFSIPIPYWQAVAIIVLIFILVITMAEYRKHYVSWGLKGGLLGTVFGFLLALILEGFLLVGGSTIITGVLGWKNAPAPISHVLDAGRNQLIQVLGTSTQSSSSGSNKPSTVQGAVQTLQSLNPVDLKTVKNIICDP